MADNESPPISMKREFALINPFNCKTYETVDVNRFSLGDLKVSSL